MSVIKNIFSIDSVPFKKVKTLHTRVVDKVIQPILELVSSIGSFVDKEPIPVVRKQEWKEQKLIEEHSRLSETVSPVLGTTLKTPFFEKESGRDLARVLGHLHGDRIIEGSELEKLPAHVGSQVLNAYLEDSSIFETAPKGLKELQEGVGQLAHTAQEIHQLKSKDLFTYSQELMGHVFKLEDGKSFFVGGESTMKDGLTYSVLYEFRKNGDKSYDLFVYTIGKEGSSYGDVLHEGSKHWVRPFMHFQNIPSEKIFFTGPKRTEPQSDLFQAILETKVLKGRESFSPKYVTTKLLGHFERYFVPSTHEVSGFMSSARSHTDLWREMKGVVFHYLGKEHYKQLALDLKVKSLIEGYQLGEKLMQEDSVEGAELRTVLKTGATNVLRSLIKFRREGWIEESVFLGYQATALDLIARIDKLEKKIATERLKKTVSLTFSKQEYQPTRQKALEAAKNVIREPKTEKTSAQTAQARLPKLWSPKDFAEGLQAFTANFSKDAVVQVAEIEHLVEQFTIPKSPTLKSSYWSKISPKHLPLAIQGLENLLKSYDVASRSGAITITPKEANTVFSLYVVLHFLALRWDKRVNSKKDGHVSRLSSYPLFFPGEFYDSDHFLSYASPEEFEKRKQIRDYCAKTGSNKRYRSLFNYDGYWYTNEKGVAEGQEFGFYAALTKQHKGLSSLKGGMFSNDLDTVANAVLHLSPDKKDNAFKKANLDYIPALAYACFVSYQFSGYTHLRNDSSGAFRLSLDPSYEPRYGSHSSLGVKLFAGKKKFNDYPGSNRTSTKLRPSSDVLYPSLSREYHSFPEGEFAVRQREYPSHHDEASILNSRSAKHPSLERACLEPSLQPHQMIYDYRDRLDRLAKPQEQTLFEIEFFRSVISSKKGFVCKNYSTRYLSPVEEWFPLQEELEQEGFIRECKAFIKEGVECYYDLQLGGRPHVFATLFFLRLSCRLARFTGEPLIDSLHYINHMLDRTDLTPEERSALSLHQILAYSVREEPLSDEEKKVVFRAWVYYRNTPLSAEWKSVLVEKEAAAFLHTLSPSKKSSLTSVEFQREVLDEALGLLGMGKLGENYVMEALPFPNIRAATEKGEYWEVNLLTGRVCCEQGVLVRGEPPSWIPKEKISRKSRETEFYEYIFASREHTYFQTGSTIYFQDPCLGQMRVVEGNILKGLQRKIGSSWYQYVYPTTLSRREIPSSLLADHTHWVPVTDPDHLLICDFKTGDKKAILTQEGEIHPYDAKSGKFDTSRILRTTFEENVLERMDQKAYILCTDSKKGLERVAYTRFKSLSDESLYFEVSDDKVIYGLNKKYALSKTQQLGLLGGIPQYLLLTHEEGEKRKVLIPRRPLAHYNPLSKLHAVDTHDKHREWRDEYAVQQQNVYTFLEYDLKGERLVPLTNEANFHLAYLLLAQREYVQAKELIEKIDYRQPLSQISTAILTDIIQICENGHDRSPESAAVALSAYHLSRKAYRRIDKGTPCTYPERAFEIYKRNRESIPAALEFTSKLRAKKYDDSIHSVTSVVDRRIDPLKLPSLKSSSAGFSESYHNYDAYLNYGIARDATKFLRDEESSQYEKTNIDLSTLYEKGYSDKGFFRFAYEIAVHGSEEEKDQLRFRLQLMEELRTDRERYDVKYKTRTNAWTILQFALRFPELMPKLPSSEVVEAWKWLVEIERLILKTDTSSTPFPLGEAVKEEHPSAPILKTILPTKKRVKEVEEPLIMETPDKEKIDGGFLAQVFREDGHLSVVPQEEPALEEVTFAYDTKWAKSEDEVSAETAIEKEFEEFQKGFVRGEEINSERKQYLGKDLSSLNDKLQEKSAALSIDLHNLEVSILEIANKIHPKEKEEKDLLRESKVEQELSMKKLIWIFLTSDRADFEAANPYLANPEFEKEIAKFLHVEHQPGIAIDYLFNLIGVYLTTAVYKKRLDRAKGHCEKILNEKTPLSELEVEDLVQKIAHELDPDHLNVYDTHQNPAFLVFEYFSGFSIRPDQVKNLLKMLETDIGTEKFKNIVIQMIMGGGKTTVLAVIILKLAAKKGHLSLFGTPSSQYSSVAHNLRKALKECFDQEMEEIDFPGDQIYKKCGEIEKRMKKTMKKGDFLLVKSETLLCLQLKLVTAVFDAVDNRTDKLSEINTLRRILLMLRESGEILIDEVDLVLHILREMNFPIGEKQHVAPERIDVIRELFLLFVSENAKISEETSINLKELIGLQHNRQTLLQETDFKGDIARAVAWKFVKESKRFMFSDNPDFHESFSRYTSGKINPTCQKMFDQPKSEHYSEWEKSLDPQDKKDFAFLVYVRDFHESFYRYISGKINPTCQKMLDKPKSEHYSDWEESLDPQDKKDFEFLVYVRDLRESKDHEKEEAAHQIAIIKHMLLTVLPMTFQKMGNRHFGRGNGLPGEVTPYLAVDTPSTNHFGYIYEWIAYHFQTVLQCGMGADQINALAAIYLEGAMASLKTKQLVLDEESGKVMAPEAYEFKKLTGVDLEDIERPGKLDEAVKHVEGHVESQLKLEAETASDQVVFHPYRVTANGISLVNMCNARVMSATPYNAHCYEDCLADNFDPELGTEGQIADLALKRIQTEKKPHVHLVHSRDLKVILKAILGKHPNPEKVRMLLDSGALFKDYNTNLEVALAIREIINMPVLFFMRDPNKGELTPDTLALLPLDSDKPRIIGGTKLEDIGKTGLSLEEYFVYGDERHTTGTDLPMPFYTIGLMTVDETMLRRTFFQTILRLRQFFAHQKIEFIIPENILPTFPSSSAKNKQLQMVLSCLMGAIRNQAIRKGKDYVRSRKQKIDSIFEQTLLKNFLLVDRNLTQEDLNKLGAFKKVLELPQIDSPYDQVGAIELAVDSIDDLIAYGQRRIKGFREAGGDEKIAEKMELAIKEVIEKAAISPWMLKTVPSPGVNELGMQVDILSEVDQEVNKEMDQEIDTELLKELEMYENLPSYNLRNEDQWDDPTIEMFLSSFDEKTPFTPKEKGFVPLALPELLQQYKYAKEYHTLFDERISATTNWAYTTSKPLPVFHRLQRPGEQLLVIKTDKGYRIVLLSQREATQFKTFLHEQYAKGKWKNVWLVMPDLSPLEDNPAGSVPAFEVADLLVQINAFNGDLTYLESHPDKTQEWVFTKGSSELKLDFLKLRVARDTVKKKRFFESPVLGNGKGFKRQIYSARLRQKVSEMKQKQIQALGEEDKRLLWMLSDRQLSLIDPNQVPLLHPYQMSKLRGKAFVSQIPERNKERIVKEQFPDLSEKQKTWFPKDAFELTPSSTKKLLKEPVLEEESPPSSPETSKKEKTFDPLSLEESPPPTKKKPSPILKEVSKKASDPVMTPVKTKLPKREDSPPLKEEQKEAKSTTTPPSPSLIKKEEIEVVIEEDEGHTTSSPHVSPKESKKKEKESKNPPPVRKEPSLKEGQKPVQENPLKKKEEMEVVVEEGEGHTFSPPHVSSTVSKKKEKKSKSPPPIETKKKIPVKESSSSERVSTTPTPLKKEEKQSQCAKVTRVALIALVGIVCIAASLVGTFAIIGAHASWAPKLFVTLSQGLGSPYVAYILTAAGPGYLFGLTLYYLIQKRRREAVQSSRV